MSFINLETTVFTIRMTIITRQWEGPIRQFLMEETWLGIEFPYREQFIWIAEMEHKDNWSTSVEIDYDEEVIEMGLKRRSGDIEFAAGKRIRIENFYTFVYLFNFSD